MEKLNTIGRKVKETTEYLSQMSAELRDNTLKEIAREIRKNKDNIIIENNKDIKNAEEKGMKFSLIDRLKLDEKKINNMSDSLLKIADLKSPIGDIIEGRTLENGLEICKKRVPLGVIAIIYESRPNVTLDAFSLCFKSGNAVILRGGSDAINTNKEILRIIKNVLNSMNIPEDIIYLIEDLRREKTIELMKLNEYVDVLIPRGGASLIKSVVENSTIPIIETGTGNCHIYIDKYADIEKAIKIIDNAKTQRIGVCNACESLVIHKEILDKILSKLVDRLLEKNVEIRGDEEVCKLDSRIVKANDSDWKTEYLDLIISVKTVNNIEDAIKHINKYSTKHSECIITENYEMARKFLNLIDSSCVYVNASTRFTDGEEFGLGAEIGISTQKLHARGPMGLKELTTTKYLIYGDGQIKE